MIFREVEDRDLIQRAARGDVDAYNVLVSRWEKRVFTYLVRLTGNREDALDLSQDAFLKAYRGLAKLDDPDRFPQWLFRIAHNEAISAFRRNRLATESDDDAEHPAESTSVGRSLANRAELTVMVEQALAALPEEQREAVLLKVYEGFKFHEIAAVTGAPVSTVKSRLYAGLEALKAMLAPEGREALRF